MTSPQSQEAKLFSQHAQNMWKPVTKSVSSLGAATAEAYAYGALFFRVRELHEAPTGPCCGEA